MLFSSYEFIFLFLPLALIVHFQVARWNTRAAAATTMISSLIFYASWKPPFVALLIASIAGNYGLASWMAMADVPARQLARTLTRVRDHPPTRPLDRVSSLNSDAQLERETRNIHQCIEFSRKHLKKS